ncbi:MAG TPA: hypothetical protein PLP06_11275, partial [Saprospiraceae bacterium]|nr:hypothetical protein [Saprospiraceae bacterium]
MITRLTWVLFLTFVISFMGNAQVVKQFEKVPMNPPAQGIFKIRGDYTIIGNTNMTLQDYAFDKQNGNNRMIYVDIDNDNATYNSSSSTLTFTQEGGLDDQCTNILYAGLYWTGRANDGGTAADTINAFRPSSGLVHYSRNQTVGNAGTITGTPLTMNVSRAGTPISFDASYTVEHNDAITHTNYTLTVSKKDANTVRYTFSSPGDTTVLFDFYINGATRTVKYSKDGGVNFINVSTPVYTDLGSNQVQMKFDPVYIHFEGNGVKLTVNRLERDNRANRTNSQYQADSKADVRAFGKEPGSPYWPRYTISGGSQDYIFEVRNLPAPLAYYSINNGVTFNVVPGTQTYSDASNNRTVNFPAFKIWVSGDDTLDIYSLVRDLRTDRSLSQTQTTSFAKVNIHGLEPGTGYEQKTLDKHQVLFKFAGDPYHQVTALGTDIYYPTTDYGQIYSAYADVTNYVKSKGLGEYSVADLALRPGNGGGTGYFGCWTMIVVYENAKMKWRDITIFNGHAFNTSPGSGAESSFNLPISGFKALAGGEVHVKLGYMAGEGDYGIPGDFFKIEKRKTGVFVPLAHSGNSTTNFFNSSIQTGGNARTPYIDNNTGIDIAMFDIVNSAANTYIDNNQDSTTFKIGTTQDLYTISMIAIGIDAYRPTLEGLINFEAINNNIPSDPPQDVHPGEPVDYCVELRNKGTEPLDNVVIHVPMPYSADFVPGSITAFVDPSVTPIDPLPVYDPITKTINWNIGHLPLPSDPTKLLAKFCYKVTATTNCDILASSQCASEIPMTGTIDGKGSVSGITFNDQSLIQGYQGNIPCQGDPINDPLLVHIDGVAYFNLHCNPNAGQVEVYIAPNPGGYPVSNVVGLFPAGTRFYNEFPIDGNTIEYDINNPFPANPSTNITYYAVPIGAGSCAIPLIIHVSASCGITVSCGDQPDLTYNCSNPIPPGVNNEIDFEARFNAVIGGTPCGTVVVKFTDGSFNPCSSTTFVRTYTIFDDLDADQVLDPGEQSFLCVKTYNYMPDTEPPMITSCPNGMELGCNPSGLPAPGVVNYLDNCDMATVSNYLGSIITDGCEKTQIRYYVVTDACGNSSTCQQTFTWTEDITKPIISCPANITVQCAADVPNANINDVVFSDNCSGTPTVTHEGDQITNQTCANKYTITRTYKVVDECNNSATCTQTITVNDNTPPTITCPVAVTVTCVGNVPAPNINDVTASDNCTGTVTKSFV